MSASPTAVPIEPFWNRLREITRYPAHMGALVTIIVLALGNLLVFLPFGRILLLFVTVAMYRYAFECLRATANGYMRPPETLQSDDSALGWKMIGLMVILLVVPFAIAVLAGPKVGMVAMLLIGLALPGAIMSLAMDESLLAALNPGKWIAILTRIGWPYLAVVGLCLVIFASQGYATALVARVLPLFLALVAVGIISNYALVVTFHLMGYLIYQYHDAVGFEPEAPRIALPATPPDPDQTLLDEAAALVREGKPEAATEMLRGHLRGRGGTPAVHMQYRKLLQLTGNKDELLRHGREYLAILLAQDKDRLALDLLRDCQALDPAFAPADADAVTRLAKLAAQTGQAQVALRLLAGFHKRFPKSRDIAQNYLLAATLLHERMNQDAKARELLLYLKQACPHDALMPDIDARLALIQKMMAAAPAAKA
ncbi:MAG: DUF4013 domain-containing protein [Proteobacteria bacterium]|nr:DUF4013 domain-containing protein [Pseudomonadota bacterium]